MDNDNLVSVVVPIYNVEKYLSYCIETLINQTYSNLEIILVNDGSTDSSGMICEEYKNKDNRVFVIHKENGGLSDARNVGLKYSKGKYILFIDSDDYVKLNMVEKLFDSCKKNQSDIGICYFEKVFDDSIQTNNVESATGDEYIISGRDIISKIYHGDGSQIAFTAWNKMYKRELFTANNIIYPVNRYHEDTFITYQLLFNAKKVSVVTEVLYYYRIRPTSIMTSLLTLKRVIDSIDAYVSSIEFFFQNNDEELLELALNCYFMKTLRFYFQEVRTVERKSRKLSIKYVLKVYKNIWEQYYKYYKESALKKILFRCFYVWAKIIT